MNAGKLYSQNEEQFVTDVNYRLLGFDYNNVSGELIPAGYGLISDGGEYIVELEDSRKIRCSLQKYVNRPTVGLPPRFVYSFTGA